MKAVNKKIIVMDLLGVILSRAAIYTMNPVAIAFFATMYLAKSMRVLLLLSTATGLMLWMPIERAIRYIIVLLLIIVVVQIVEHRGVRLPPSAVGAIAGIVAIAVQVADGFKKIGWNEWSLLILIEGILIFTFQNIFYKGTTYIIHARRGQALNNEELISVSILVALIVYSLANINLVEFSIMETVAYLLVLVMGFKYGAGAGAICGTACGIVFYVSNRSPDMVGIMCILGISAGVFRRIGKIGSVVSFVIITISLGYFYDNTLLEVAQVRALVSSVLVFVLIPKKILYQVELIMTHTDRTVEQNNMQDIARGKLKEFSESFQKLSKSFYDISEVKTSLNREDINQIFDGLSDKLCRNCHNCNQCWKNNFYDTYKAAFAILSSAERNGEIKREDIPVGFAKQCVHLESFLNETNRGLELANLNLHWYNKMAQSREAIAGQLGEVASIIQDFSHDLYDTVDLERSMEERIMMQLKVEHIDVKSVSVMERRNKRQDIYLVARTRKGRCITTKEAASIVSRVFGKRMKPAEGSKNILSKDFDTIVLVEETNFKTLTGMARVAKDSEQVSGDNFSFLYLDNGEMIMTLSDGMGSGENACEDSESVIELLEQFMEAGFKEESAIKLINSIMVLRADQQRCSTIDMGIINLFSGMCDFVKIGAAASFIKRDKWVETITSTSLPAGVLNQVDIDGITKKLYDGDIVVMLTDGVLDCIKGDEKEKYIEVILEDIKTNNPQEIANEILERAKQENDNVAMDDMTVLVVGLWKK